MTHRIITYAWLALLTAAVGWISVKQDVHWSMTTMQTTALKEIADYITLANKK